MLSVIIPTQDSERALVATLAALVPAAMEGFVAEVVIADAGSRDDTAAVADVAGCKFRTLEGPLGKRLKTAAASARTPWLLFLRPGTVLDASWVGEARRFIERTSAQTRAAKTCAATFRRGAPAQPALGEALSLLAAALGARPRPQQGLIIAKRFYEDVGGHAEGAADPEADLIRRIGRRRLARLASIASTIG
jgi:glycosyltransferase involved in cell wall biosynthesis